MKKMKLRARESKPNVRRYKRDLIRQIASFYNLSRNQEFLRDIESVRRSFGMELPRPDGKAPSYVASGVGGGKKALLSKLKEEYGPMPMFEIKRGSYDAHWLCGHMFGRVKYTFWEALHKLTLKWRIRQEDAFAIVYGNDYPPYLSNFKVQNHMTLYQLILREIDGMEPPSKEFIEKVQTLRKAPETERFWWIRRFQSKSLSVLIKPYLIKKISPKETCDALLESGFVDEKGNPYTYEAVRKAIARSNKKMGQ